VIEMIKAKLLQYRFSNAVEEENAIKEIMQEIALYALWRADFFDVALFQGGTSLRILYNLPRFSEDLDFMLRVPDPAFDWAFYLKTLRQIFAQFGLKLDVQPKERMDSAIREAILKDDSIASQLDLTFANTGRRKIIKIKLEVDTNPPLHSGEALSFLDFPSDYLVRHQDLPSNFALKIHALLCRGYLKGRDWYDFSWYVSNGISPNLVHLQAALFQSGPWAGKDELKVDMKWLTDALRAAILAIDWKKAAEDVRRFLKPVELKSVELWGAPFFLAKVEKMSKA
jgi:Nucleotidyl transferase AbiEii toxin, Type IV TA system